MKRIFLILSLVICLCSCSIDNISVNTDDPTENEIKYSEEVESSQSSAAEVSEKNLRPKVGEKFYCDTFVKSGTLYATVTGAEYYENIHDAKIQTENFDNEILEAAKKFDPDTGVVLPDEEGSEQIFILVHVTIENIDAVSITNDSADFFKGLDPELYSDGYCGDYDFSSKLFGISVYPKENAADTVNIGGLGVDYFSLKGKTYSDFYRTDLYHIAPGESVSFDIGAFRAKMIDNEGMVQIHGGEIGDSLIPRYVLNTANSKYHPYVELGLK